MSEVTRILSAIERGDANAVEQLLPLVYEVKLRYFAGLTIDETAQTLGLSVRTANRHWAYAKAWLYQ